MIQLIQLKKIEETMDTKKLLQQVEKIYKEIAEEDMRLCEDFLSISIEITPFFVIPAVSKQESRVT